MTWTDWLPAFPGRQPRVSTLGLATWDATVAFDPVPSPDRGVLATRQFNTLGGSTALSAATLARLGAATSLYAQIGDHENGRALIQELNKLGVDSSQVSMTTLLGAKTDTVSTTEDSSGRTEFQLSGARLALGNQIDIARLFANDIVLIDVDDLPLRRFLLDLPAHTLPAARLLGTLNALTDPAVPGGVDILMRHDAVVGNARQFRQVAMCNDLQSAIREIQVRMRGETLRAAIVDLDAGGSLAFTIDERWTSPAFPVAEADPSCASDAFAGAIAFGMACRWDWSVVLRFANAVKAISTRTPGARVSYPSWGETIAFLVAHEPDSP